MFDNEYDVEAIEHPCISYGTMQEELARLTDRQETLKARLDEVESQRSRLLARLLRFQGTRQPTHV